MGFLFVGGGASPCLPLKTISQFTAILLVTSFVYVSFVSVFYLNLCVCVWVSNKTREKRTATNNHLIGYFEQTRGNTSREVIIVY